MPLPASWTTVAVTWTIIGHDGTPAKGVVRFTSAQVVTADGGTYVPAPITARVTDGVMESVNLPTTDDPDISPTGWTWRVQPLTSPDGPEAFNILVPAAGGPINLATVAPVSSPTPLSAVAIGDQFIAGRVNDATSVTRTALDAAYAVAATMRHEVRKHEIRKAKGGRIGTNGKGVVAWRVDHQIDEHRTTTWPILRTRGMPCGVGIVTNAVGDAANVADPTATTWAQARTMMWEGCEVWSHSATHLAPLPEGSGTGAPVGLTLAEEIEGSRETLEANAMRPMGWQMPGVTGCLSPDYSANFTSTEQFASPAGQRLLSNYGLVECGQQIPGGQPRFLPTDGVYGYAHTVTVESATLAQCQAWVDAAVSRGVGVELMFHPRYIGQPDYMSVADFTALADYVKAAWDAGSIEVLTPSALAFADPGSSFRVQLLRDTGFEGVSTSSVAIGAWTLNNNTGITLGTDGGHAGSNYVRFSGSLNYAQQAYTNVLTAGIQGAAMVVEAWARNASANPSVARVYVIDNSGNNPTFIRDIRTDLAAGAGWTRIRVPLVIPVTCSNLLVRISRFTTGSDGKTGDVDFDDVTLRAI